MTLGDDARDYHRRPSVGKVEVTVMKPTNTQRDLGLTYSLGVVASCHDITEDENTTCEYTAEDNPVGVISNGSATLGLGNVGA